MRYDRMIDELERLRAKYESGVRALIQRTIGEDAEIEKRLLGKKPTEHKKKRGWTKEQRAAHSKRLKAVHRKLRQQKGETS